MRDHLNRITEGLTTYGEQNHQPAVDEPVNGFEKWVNEHAELQDLIAKVKSLLKPAEAAERKLRDGIADSLRTFFADNLKEGVNNYELSNGRQLKFKNNVERKIEESQIETARLEYGKTDPTASFDDLLRVKYELAKREYDKLDEGQKLAVSRMLVTKFSAPGVEVD